MLLILEKWTNALENCLASFKSLNLQSNTVKPISLVFINWAMNLKIKTTKYSINKVALFGIFIFNAKYIRIMCKNSLLIIKSLSSLFHYTRCNTPKRVTSWRGPSPRHCARATQLLSKKCRSGGEPLATLCPILPARDLNLRPHDPETNALPLDQLVV